MERLICVVQHDGPGERTGVETQNKVQHGSPDEGPRGARESTRTSRDGVYFHKSMDIGVVRRSAASYKVSGEGVSVRRCEDTGPEAFMGKEVGLHLIGHGKATKMGRISRPAPIDKQCGELDLGDFNCLDGAAEGYFLL